MSPLSGGRRRRFAVDIRPRQQAHSLREGQAALSREALHRLEFIERRLQPFMIDLDPFAAQQRKAIGRRQEVLLFPRQTAPRRRGSRRGENRGDIERRPLTGHSSPPSPRRWDGSDGSCARSPAYAQQFRPAPTFRRLLGTALLFWRPSERMENFSCVDDLLQPSTVFAGLAHRLQEFQEFFPVACVGVFA